ncbi:MAG: Holliday junction resolvase RuvX [Alphaproteobacteria bacterium]|jgi:putative Holliday junction resolvase|nr:Holliday junction resolvase RuvX [Alphaproteobacteria bacterium]
MISHTILDFKSALPNRGRLLGFDLGEKTLGIALSDLDRMIATPLETLIKDKFSKLLEEIQTIIQKHNIKGIVIGLPMNMNGSEGPRCESVRQFAKNIEPSIDLPLLFWDERLSTMAVSRIMIEADLTRKRQKQVVDKMAASYILQGALDALKY